jgi:hypothetical protein
MPLQHLANRNRSGAYADDALHRYRVFSMFFFLTQFLQNILGWSPSRPGSASCP